MPSQVLLTQISSSVFPFVIKKLQVSQGGSLQRNSGASFSMSLVFSFIVTEKFSNTETQPLLSLKLQGTPWSESQLILRVQTSTDRYKLNDVSEPPSFGRGCYQCTEAPIMALFLNICISSAEGDLHCSGRRHSDTIQGKSECFHVINQAGD